MLLTALTVAACWLSVKFLGADRRARPQPDWIAHWAYGYAAAALLLFVAGLPRILPRLNPALLALALAHLVIALLVRWNQAYIAFLPSAPYRREVFRKKLERPALPIYGDATPTTANAIWLASLLGIAVLIVAAPWIARRMNRWVGWLLVLALSATAVLTLAWTESRERLLGDTTSYSNFSVDLVDFKGPRDILERYVSRMPDLGWFGRHYPPGNLLLFRMQEQLRDGNQSVRQSWARYERRSSDGVHDDIDIGRPPRLPPQTFVLGVVVLGALGSLPLFAALGRELGLRRGAARFAACIVAFSAGAIVYPTVSTMSLLLLPAALAWWSFQRGLRGGEWWCGALCGAALFAYAFFSFSVSLVGLVLFLAMLGQLITRRVKLRNALRICASAAAVGITLWLGTRLLTGYDALQCLIVAVREHAAQQHSNPFSPRYMWWLRSSGNLLAYLFSAAPVVGAALALLLVPRGRAVPVVCWLAATLLTMAIGSFGGLFWLETERIWIFFTPLFAIAASAAIDRLVPASLRLETRIALLAACVALVLTFDTVFKPYI